MAQIRGWIRWLSGTLRLNPWLPDVAQDARHGFRTLRHDPVFTTVALVTLALAIGANTAIFSLINVLVLRNLPVRGPARLVEFIWRYPGDPPMNFFSAQNYKRYRDHNSVFSDVIGTSPFTPDSHTAGVAADTLSGEYVTGNFFPALGVRPALGRLLGPHDDEPGAAPVAVVSWTYWKSQFNLDPRILDTRIVVEDVPAAVVGVANQAFFGLVVGYTPDVWIPAAAHRGERPVPFRLMARLKEGASIERARAEMRVLDRSRIEEFARTDPQWRTVTLDVEPARTGLSTPLHDQFGNPLLVLMAIVGALLLLACANIASLLLARAAARQREMAVRVSLGAGRFRIVRQVLTESLLLSIAGSLLGIIGAHFGADMLVRIMTSGTRMIRVPPHLHVAVDARVLMFTTAVTVLAAVLFGLAPAWSAFASAPASALKGGGGIGQIQSRRLFGNSLVVAQVALSLVLLSVSELYVGHLSNLRNRDLGFDRTSVLLVSVDTARSGQSRDQLNQLYKEVLGRLEAIPGVRSATLSGMTPISGAAGSRFVTVEGFQEAPQARRRLSLNEVAPNYFATFGTRLIAGRDFQAADAGQPRVAVVNQAMARHYFAGGNPVGKHVWFDDDSRPYKIVGLVADAKYADVRTPAPPIMYVHYSDLFNAPSEFSLRTSVPPAAVAGDVRRVIDDVLRNVPVTRVTTLAEQVDASIVPERLIATLSGFFGGVGVLLAAIGLYGLLAYTVARRTYEIGVRMALGAMGRDVMAMVLKSALWLVCAGLIIGAPVAVWSKRVAASMVQNLPADSLLPIVVAAAVTIGVALLAAAVPARRATRISTHRAPFRVV